MIEAGRFQIEHSFCAAIDLWSQLASANRGFSAQRIMTAYTLRQSIRSSWSNFKGKISAMLQHSMMRHAASGRWRRVCCVSMNLIAEQRPGRYAEMIGINTVLSARRPIREVSASCPVTRYSQSFFCPPGREMKGPYHLCAQLIRFDCQSAFFSLSSTLQAQHG